MSQRWRLTVARGPDGRDVPHRDVTAAWTAILSALADLAAQGVPRSRDPADNPPPDERDSGRARVMFAAPVPLGMTSQGELVDLVLPTGRLTRDRLWACAVPLLPTGHRLVEAHDVWIGEPSLPSLEAAADYLDTVPSAERGASADAAAAVSRAAGALLSQAVIARPGRDSARASANLRPLIVDLRLADAADETMRIWIRLRVDQELGSGRPEEVVEALGRIGPSLTVVAVERVGFVLKSPPPRVNRAAARPTRQPPRRSDRPGGRERQQ